MHLPPRIQYHIFLICTLLYSTNCSFIFYTLHHINGKEKEFKKGILLDVTYDIKYKNDNQPESNGLNSMIYELVWDDGRYLISSIGTGP